jgi:hypothetical protein
MSVELANSQSQFGLLSHKYSSSSSSQSVQQGYSCMLRTLGSNEKIKETLRNFSNLMHVKYLSLKPDQTDEGSC